MGEKVSKQQLYRHTDTDRLEELVVISNLLQLLQISHRDQTLDLITSSQPSETFTISIQTLISMLQSKTKFSGALRSVGLLQIKILSLRLLFSTHFSVGGVFPGQTQFSHPLAYAMC